AAIGRGPRDGFSPDHSATAGAVLDQHGHALTTANLLTQDAGNDVGSAAGRIRIDDLDRSRCLRPSTVIGQGDGKETKNGGTHCDMQKSSAGTFHRCPPCAGQTAVALVTTYPDCRWGNGPVACPPSRRARYGAIWSALRAAAWRAGGRPSH